MATMKKMRSEDPTKNRKLTNVVTNTVYQKVLVHYEKANILTKHYTKCIQDILKINNEYKLVNKSKISKRIDEFRKKLKKTMPFWSRGILDTMVENFSNNLMENFLRERLVEDAAFLKSMMGSRKASYTSSDIAH